MDNIREVKNMIDFTKNKVAEIIHYYISHEGLDGYILDPILAPYEKDEEMSDIIATAIHDAGKQYFVIGYLLGKL